jgi:hypothetical protein
VLIQKLFCCCSTDQNISRIFDLFLQKSPEHKVVSILSLLSSLLIRNSKYANKFHQYLEKIKNYSPLSISVLQMSLVILFSACEWFPDFTHHLISSRLSNFISFIHQMNNALLSAVGSFIESKNIFSIPYADHFTPIHGSLFSIEPIIENVYYFSLNDSYLFAFIELEQDIFLISYSVGGKFI